MYETKLLFHTNNLKTRSTQNLSHTNSTQHLKMQDLTLSTSLVMDNIQQMITVNAFFYFQKKC